MPPVATLRVPKILAPIAAWAVVVAFLVQALLGAPMAARMLAAAAGPGANLAAFPLCSGSGRGDPGGDPQDRDGPAGGNHDHCLICHAGFGAALPPVPVLAIALLVAGVIAFAVRAPESRPQRGVAGYASRGPPLAA
jgi:hypothetical protein